MRTFALEIFWVIYRVLGIDIVFVFLALELHSYVDACSEIVDRAQKELIIEKALKKIDETWSGLDLAFLSYQETDMLLVQVRKTDDKGNCTRFATLGG